MSAPTPPSGGTRIGWPGIAIAVSATISSVALAAGTLLQQPRTPPAADGSEGPDPSFALEQPLAAETPGPIPDMVVKGVNLSDVGWWDVAGFGYGYCCGASADDPETPVFPAEYYQVRIGTLDGRVTAMFAVDLEWGHWYVSGPVGGEVLVVDDHATHSTIRAVNARTGGIRLVLHETDVINAAIRAPTSGDLYYMTADRATNTGVRVWRRTADDRDQLVDEGPAAYGEGPVDIRRLSISPDERTLVSQFCKGQVSCLTSVVDVASGDRQRTRQVGWVASFEGRSFITKRLRPRERVAVSLDTLAIEPTSFSGADAREEFGAELPAGWTATWPRFVPIDSNLRWRSKLKPALLASDDGRKIQAPLLKTRWPLPDCAPITPEVTPTGRVVGPMVNTLEEGVRYATTGMGDDLFIEAIGEPIPEPDDLGAENWVFVRGHRAYVALTPLREAPPDAPHLQIPVPTIQWGQDGCAYQVQLPGLTREEAREYAGRI